MLREIQQNAVDSRNHNPEPEKTPLTRRRTPTDCERPDIKSGKFDPTRHTADGVEGKSVCCPHKKIFPGMKRQEKGDPTRNPLYKSPKFECQDSFRDDREPRRFLDLTERLCAGRSAQKELFSKNRDPPSFRPTERRSGTSDAASSWQRMDSPALRRRAFSSALPRPLSLCPPPLRM